MLQKQIEPDLEKFTITDDIMMVIQDGHQYQLITDTDNIATLHGRRIACHLQTCGRAPSCVHNCLHFALRVIFALSRPGEAPLLTSDRPYVLIA